MPAQIDDDGLQVILTPIQLAALLQQASLQSSATMADRFWGALGVIGGAVDLVATVPLWLAPEPISKVAAGAIDYVGADVASTGLRQVWTGRREITLTAKVVDRSLRSLGVDPSIAGQLGSNTDIAMNMAALIATPLSVANAARAARVTSVERGLIDLEAEEKFPGAHTIAKHVGQTVDDLRLRLAREPGLTRASSFRTLEDAEKGVSDVIRVRAVDIQSWASTAREGARRAFDLPNTSVRGISVSRAGAASEVSGVQVVLRKMVAENRVYYVLTAYPL